MFASNLLVYFVVIMGLIFLVMYLTRKKKNNTPPTKDVNAKTELAEGIASYKDAKEHFTVAEEKVSKEKDLAKERLEDAENLKKEIDSKKSIIT